MSGLSTECFINKARTTHGDRYDYSLVNYVNSYTKVKIICSKHGIFEQSPTGHLKGYNCKKCADKEKIKTTDCFINDAKLVHGDKYDYSLVNYMNNSTKIKIICKEHGIFTQTPYCHLKGSGCNICDIKNKTKTKENFINDAKLIHGDKYDYSLVNYINSYTKVKIICKIHGVFEQQPNNHLNGKACIKCGNINCSEKQIKSNNIFINDAKLVHGNKYDYSVSEYNKAKNKIIIRCPEHGEFIQEANSHLMGRGCPKCSLKYDKNESEISDFIKSLSISLEIKNKTILNGKELDIYIPSHKLAIEFNGLYWHSELYKDKNYHLNKTLECEKQGIQLIHIFEDEWLFKQDIVKSRLKNILGLTTNKIYARKCIVKEVSTNESKYFLNNNHIQGNTNSKINIGLYHNNELVSIMTFNLGRIFMSGKNDEYELVRFCNKLDTTVIGGADKLLQYFIKNYDAITIVSYADRRWSQGNLYDKLGFDFVHNTKPNYFYLQNKIREHRFKYRKSILIKQGFDKNKSEHQIMLERGKVRIYDCGVKKYVLKLN